jgi:hypothetical protein
MIAKKPRKYGIKNEYMIASPANAGSYWFGLNRTIPPAVALMQLEIMLLVICVEEIKLSEKKFCLQVASQKQRRELCSKGISWLGHVCAMQS